MSSTKLRRALVVRDAVMPWLREHGTLEIVKRRDDRIETAVHATIDGFDIWYQTPFGKGISRDLPGFAHGLQISGCMTLEWADDGRADFSFRAGKWDSALLRALDKAGV